MAATIEKNLYNNYQRNARRRGVVFKISFMHFRRLIAMNCYICESEPLNERRLRKLVMRYNGVDRVNNKKGYIRGNVQPCCRKCNQIKGQMALEDLRTHIAKMVDGFKKVG